jgi:pimeloyl-ACP methyl ester carboxylesterase
MFTASLARGAWRAHGVAGLLPRTEIGANVPPVRCIERLAATWLLLSCVTACSQAVEPDCPPPNETASIDEAPPDTDASTPEPEPTLASEPEALAVQANDGHELRLWALLPTGEPTERRAIVLLHGRTWSSLPDFALRVGEDASLSLMHALARRGVAVYALDLRGYGGTARDASGWVEPDRAAEDLFAALALVKQREGVAPDLLGWSLGSLVAQLTVQRHPEAARSLVLYGYPRDLDKRTPVAQDGAAPAKQPNTETAARSDFITDGTISPEAMQAYVTASLAADPVRADWRAMQQFDALDPAAITIPTLVIYGVHDPIAKQLWQAKLFTRMRVEDRQWVVIPNADHAAHLEQPARFMAALAGFLGV